MARAASSIPAALGAPPAAPPGGMCVPAAASRPAHAQPNLLHISLADLKIDQRKIGRGGFGDVYHAVWRHTDVAVKKLRVEHMSEVVLDEFYREVSFLHALPYHDNVLQIHGVCVDEDRGVYWMVTQWMAGGSLFDFLKTSAGKSLSDLSRIGICIQAAMGIRHLHDMRQPVLHRDIKSLNFLIDTHGNVRVGDFGLAKIRTVTVTRSGQGQDVVGTLRWMPPEFLRVGGKKSASTASDVYSLAVVLWEILTGLIPFDGDDDDTVREAIRHGEMLAIPAHLPPTVAHMLRQCWRLDPNDRPTCVQLIQALNFIQAGLFNGQTAVVAVAAAPGIAGAAIKEVDMKYTPRQEAAEIDKQQQNAAIAAAARKAEQQRVEAARRLEQERADSERRQREQEAQRQDCARLEIERRNREQVQALSRDWDIARAIVNAIVASDSTSMINLRDLAIICDKLQGLFRAANCQVRTDDPAECKRLGALWSSTLSPIRSDQFCHKLRPRLLANLRLYGFTWVDGKFRIDQHASTPDTAVLKFIRMTHVTTPDGRNMLVALMWDLREMSTPRSKQLLDALTQLCKEERSTGNLYLLKAPGTW